LASGILKLLITIFREVKTVPVEGIILLFFILVLAPIVAVLAYCGIRGTCGQNDEENKGSKQKP